MPQLHRRSCPPRPNPMTRAHRQHSSYSETGAGLKAATFILSSQDLPEHRDLQRHPGGRQGGQRLTRHGADPVPGSTAHLLPGLGLQLGWCLLCLSHVHTGVRAEDRRVPAECDQGIPWAPGQHDTVSHAGLGSGQPPSRPGRQGQKSGHLNSGPPCSSPESRPSRDRVPVPTLVVTVTSLFPTSQVLVLPPARRNSPTGDLKAQECRSIPRPQEGAPCATPAAPLTKCSHRR